MFHKAEFILFKKLPLILKAYCLAFWCYDGNREWYSFVVIFLMSIFGRFESWPHCGTRAFEFEMFLACQPNSQGTTEPGPSGRRLRRKSLSLGNSPSAVEQACHLVFASLSLSTDREERPHVNTQVRGEER